MKKIIVCNIPMKENVDLSVYKSDDLSLPASNRAVRYPINAFLEEELSANDDIKVLLLVKKDKYSHYEKNTTDFIDELNDINKEIKAKIEYKLIDTEFKQTQAIHEQLMASIIDEIDVNSHILADITYGSKDMPIVLFSALNFAEKFLDCEIENIIYGQANFVDGKVVNTRICDMMPLYCLNSVTETIQCNDPEKAKQMLKTLLSL